MKKKTGEFEMQVKPIAVVSVHNGAVDALIKCELLGTVMCRATKIGFQQFSLRIWEVENSEPMQGFTKLGLEAFNKGIREISLAMITHCYSFPDKWAVVEQADEYDVLMLKQDMDKDVLASCDGKVSRFPLFKEYTN
jgi:hypothetical protein